MVGEADLIIAMTANHRETVGIIDPGALAYTFLLTDLSGGGGGDVPDPIGLGYDQYEKTFDLIERCLRSFKDTIKTFNGWKRA